MEDDSEIECEVLTIFEVEEQDYIALLHDNGEEDGEIFIYRYFEDEDGEPGLVNIISSHLFLFPLSAIYYRYTFFIPISLL